MMMRSCVHDGDGGSPRRRHITPGYLCRGPARGCVRELGFVPRLQLGCEARGARACPWKRPRRPAEPGPRPMRTRGRLKLDDRRLPAGAAGDRPQAAQGRGHAVSLVQRTACDTARGHPLPQLRNVPTVLPPRLPSLAALRVVPPRSAEHARTFSTAHPPIPTQSPGPPRAHPGPAGAHRAPACVRTRPCSRREEQQQQQ